MMSLEERLKDPDYWHGQTELDLFRQFDAYLGEAGQNVESFSDKSGISLRDSRKVLNGDFNGSVFAFIEFCLAMGKVPVITYRPLDEVIAEAKGEKC